MSDKANLDPDTPIPKIPTATAETHKWGAKVQTALSRELNTVPYHAATPEPCHALKLTNPPGMPKGKF